MPLTKGMGQVNLDSGLVAWFPMDAGSPWDIGPNLLATDFVSATATTDRFGIANKAYDFDGLGDRITLLDPDGDISFDNFQDFSVSVWAEPQALQVDVANVDNDIISIWEGNAPFVYPYAVRYLNQTSGTDQTAYGSRFSGNVCFQQPSTQTELGAMTPTFHHLVFQKAGDSLYMYLDGALQNVSYDTVEDTLGCGGVSTQNFSPLTLGARNTGSVTHFFRGKIDEVRIFDRALSQNEISALATLNAFQAFNDTICTGETYSFGGQQLTTAGVYVDTLLDSSLLILNLTVSDPQFTVTVENVSCPGGEDGKLIINANGGIFPYRYIVDGDTFASNVIDTSANFYTVQVIDDRACLSGGSGVFLLENPGLTFTETILPNNCAGKEPTLLYSGFSGGEAPYSLYLNGSFWGNVNNDSVQVSAISPGFYGIRIEDSNGCDSVFSVTIPPLDPLPFDTVITDVSCTGLSDGRFDFTITAAQGVWGAELLAPGEITLGILSNIGPGQSAAFTNLAAAPYDIAIYDDQGCLYFFDFEVDSPDAPLVLFPDSIGNATCGGLADGFLSVVAAGGIPPYDYSLNGASFQASNEFPNLTAGAFEVSTLDQNGCLVSDLFTVGVGDLDLEFVPSPINCAGGADGEIRVVATGGATPYTYSLTPIGGVQIGQGTTFGNLLTFLGLTAGEYEFVLTDAEGCELRDTLQLTEPPALSLTLIQAVNESGCNTEDGEITIEVMGGTAPYRVRLDTQSQEFLLLTDGDNLSFQNLASGQRAIQVVDANGCETSLIVPLIGANQPSWDVILDTARCIGVADGGIRIALNASTSPVDVQLIGGVGPITLNAGDTATFSGLTRGGYAFTLMDAVCGYEQQVVLPGFDTLTIQVDTTASGNEVPCLLDSMGRVSLFAQGGNGDYTFRYVLGTDTTQLAENIAAGLSSGEYEFLVTDGNNCVAQTDFTAYRTPSVRFSGLVPDTLCQVAEAISLVGNPSGGIFSGVGVVRLALDTNEFSFFPPLAQLGDNSLRYRFTAFYLDGQGDSIGCTNSILDTIFVQPQPNADFVIENTALCNGVDVIFRDRSQNSGATPVLWDWNFGDGTELSYGTPAPDSVIHTYLASAGYVAQLIVTSASGCQDTTSRLITIGAAPELSFNDNAIQTGLCLPDPAGLEAQLSISPANFGQEIELYWTAQTALGTLSDTLWTTTLSANNVGDTLIAFNPDMASIAGATLPIDAEVELTLLAGNCPVVKNRRFPILPVITLTTDSVYAEDFEQSAGSWTGLPDQTLWDWRAQGSVNDTLFGNGIWGTRLDSGYIPNDVGGLYSPCFDLTQLSRPTLNLRVASDTDLGNDGASVGYSLDGGQSWSVLGGIEDDMSSGLNWYNEEETFGLDAVLTTEVGWSGSLPFQTAAHRLDEGELRTGLLQNKLRLRVFFGADERPDSLGDRRLRGFALDSVALGARDRIVLIESFSTATSAAADRSFIEQLQTQFLNDFIPLQYDLPTGPYFEDNPTPPQARSLYYGISSGGQLVMDGGVFNQDRASFTQNSLNLRSLEFLESADLSWDSTQQSLFIKAPVVGDVMASLRLALVEDLTDATGLVRAILPNAAGVPLFMLTGQEQTLEIDPNFLPDFTFPVEVDDAANVYGVVWLQDLESREVLQALRIPAQNWEALLTGLAFERRSGPRSPGFSEVRIYPNPTQSDVTLAFPESIGEGITLRILDVKGREVRGEVIPAGTSLYTLSLEDVANGVYLVEVTGGGYAITQRLVLIP